MTVMPLDVGTISKALYAGKMRAADLIELFLDRISAIDGRLGAFARSTRKMPVWPHAVRTRRWLPGNGQAPSMAYRSALRTSLQRLTYRPK